MIIEKENLSWRLTKSFSEVNHLFTSLINLDYEIELFLCSCGRKQYINKTRNQELEYTCDICENKIFMDANLAWKNIEAFIGINKNIESFFSVIKTNKGIESKHYISVPQKFSVLEDKVIFEKKTINSLVLTYKGHLVKYNNRLYDVEELKMLKRKLGEYLEYNRTLNIPYSDTQKMTLTKASFFLKHQFLKSFELYYWKGIEHGGCDSITIENVFDIKFNRKEKSVKKAIYKNYLHQMDEYGIFNDFFNVFFSFWIEDPNILVKLIGLNMDRTMHLSIMNKNQSHMFQKLIHFLFEKNYTENEIFKILDSIKDDIIFIDTVILMYQVELHEELERMITKVSPNIYEIHDEITNKLFNLEYYIDELTIFDYSKNENDLCININEFEVKLPKDTKELYFWAEALQNCMVGYRDEINKKRTIIYCFFKNDKICFAVELKNNIIRQATGKYNRELNDREKKALEKWSSIDILIHLE